MPEEISTGKNYKWPEKLSVPFVQISGKLMNIIKILFWNLN